MRGLFFFVLGQTTNRDYYKYTLPWQSISFGCWQMSREALPHRAGVNSCYCRYWLWSCSRNYLLWPLTTISHAPGAANTLLSILMLMAGWSDRALLAQPAPSGVGPQGVVCQWDGSPPWQAAALQPRGLGPIYDSVAGKGFGRLRWGGGVALASALKPPWGLGRVNYSLCMHCNLPWASLPL